MNGMTDSERAEFHKAKYKALAGQATAKHVLKLSAKLSTALNERNESRAEIARLRAALQRIARWHGEFPATGKFWDEEKTLPTSYAAEYGSNGERDFVRQVALDALGPNGAGNRLAEGKSG